MQRELDILIIEDVPRDAEAIEKELREACIPFRARRLETREQFLQQLQGAPPDIVLSDFTLPQFDALEALNLLHKHRPDIPFILVTGSRSEEVAVECIKEGADDYILKASLKRLPSSILNALEKKSAEQAKARAESALRRSEEQFRLIAENSRDLISLVDLDGRFIYASPSFRDGLGYTPEDLPGTSVFNLVHTEDQQALWGIWQESLATRNGRSAEFRARHHNGEWRVLEASGNWIFDEEGQPQRSVIVFRDITRRKQAEDSLRAMPRLIRQAQEQERRRVARELHDSVNQILSSVKFRIEATADRLEPEDHPAWADAHKARLLLERSIQEVRRISRNLRPSELDDLGLMPALRSLCEEFTERTRVQISLTSRRVPRTLPADTELNLYRIVQEALNNIEKHSRALLVDLTLLRTDDVLRVSIRDNGCGFEPDQPAQRGGRSAGMGLTDMRERAAFMGGTCVFHAGRGRGTEVIVSVPIQNPRPKPRRTNPKGKSEDQDISRR